MSNVNADTSQGPGPVSLAGLLVRKTAFEVLLFTGILSGLLVSILCVSLWRFHARQVNTWIQVMPASLLPHLVESDYFFVTNKIQLLYSTGLFRSIRILDPKGESIVLFPKEPTPESLSFSEPIQDDAGVTWGVLEYNINYTPVLVSIAVTLLLAVTGLLLLFALLRKRLSLGVSSVLAPFQGLLGHVERLPHQLRESEPIELTVAQSKEEATVNRVIGKLIAEVRDREREIVRYTVEIERKRQLDEIARVAAQVSHDIRSPLHALRMIQPSLAALPESIRLILRNAIVRIEDIVNTLVAEKRVRDLALQAEESTAEPHLLTPLLQSIVVEKQIQLVSRPDINLVTEGLSTYPCFSKVEPGEFKRLISNILQNSLEAIASDGLVSITLHASGEGYEITVSDNGPGIHPDRLTQLGELGRTFGKAHGTGLGLFHARTHILRWGGRFRIDSNLGVGTSVHIWLPSAPPNPGFASAIQIGSDTKYILVLDDDPSIHAIWTHRFHHELSQDGFQLIHFIDVDQFFSWIGSHGVDHTVFLLDYELRNSDLSGLDIARELGLSQDTYLITSHHDDAQVIRECEILQVGLIPKAVAASVTIVQKGVPYDTPQIPASDSWGSAYVD